MKKQKTILISLLVLFLTSNFLNGQISPYKLLINPYTKVIPNIRHSIERVDVKINNFDLAGKINGILMHRKYKNIIEIIDFDKMANLSKIFKDYGNKLFIDSVRMRLSYKPDIFLFTDIDKKNGMVVLQAEIFDVSVKSRAFAECEIGFQDFIDEDYLVENKINDIVKDLICELTDCEPSFGFFSLKKYQRTLGNFKQGIGMGLSFEPGTRLTLENISSELRTIQPHVDDAKYRASEILPKNIPDNYLVRENRVDINLGQRLSIDIMQISFWGIINLAIRTTNVNESGQSLNENLFRKWYVTNNTSDPDNPKSGTAYIYYGIQSKSRRFFEKNSISLPLFITYPVLYAGRKKEVIFKLLGGTNVLLPAKIELESENGWYRFGAYDIQNKSSIGNMKEIEWFAGIDIEGSLSKTLKLGFQITQIYSDYKGDFNIPLSLKFQDKGSSSLRMSLIRMF